MSKLRIHIRLSVIIVDNKALIFTPVALSWEAEPEKITFPNGFIGGSHIADSLLKQMNIREEIFDNDTKLDEKDEIEEGPNGPADDKHQEKKVESPKSIGNVIPFPG